MKFIPESLRKLKPEVKVHNDLGHTWTEKVYPKFDERDDPDFDTDIDDDNDDGILHDD